MLTPGFAKVRIQGWVKNPDGTLKGNFDFEGVVNEDELGKLQAAGSLPTMEVTPPIDLSGE